MIEYHAVKIRQENIVVTLSVVGLLSALIIFVGSKKVGREIVPRFSLTKISQENTLTNNQTGSPDASLGDANANIPRNLPTGVNAFNLKAVKGKNGEATVLAVRDDGNFVVDIETTLTDPTTGTNYAVWLVRKGSEENLYLGQLKKVQDKYLFSTTQRGALEDYRLLKITQETNNDQAPETLIFEKSL